jgi:hypothetical protein
MFTIGWLKKADQYGMQQKAAEKPEGEWII